MMKQWNVLIAYPVGLLIAVEKWNIHIATVVLLMICSGSLTVVGTYRFSWFGMGIQFLSMVCSILNIALQAHILS